MRKKERGGKGGGEGRTEGGGRGGGMGGFRQREGEYRHGAFSHPLISTTPSRSLCDTLLDLPPPPRSNFFSQLWMQNAPFARAEHENAARHFVVGDAFPNPYAHTPAHAHTHARARARKRAHTYTHTSTRARARTLTLTHRERERERERERRTAHCA